MRNLHKLLIVLISVAFVASGVIAQNDVRPNMNNQKVIKVTPDKPYNNYQVMGAADRAPVQQDFNQDQLKQLENSGITEAALKTQEGMAKAEELLKMKSANIVYPSSPQLSSFSSKPIYGTDDVVTVTIGNETTVSTGTGQSPFGTLYEDGQNQILFTSTELAIAGLGAGDITEIGWEVVTPGSPDMAGFNIEVKHTTATSVTLFEDGFTNVYSGTHTAVAGWNMFTFTAPFAYDGTSNLLVKVCFDNDEWSSTSSVYSSATAEPMNGYAYNDLTAGCTDPYEGNYLDRPNTRLTGEESLGAPPGFPFDEMPINGSLGVAVDGDLTWTFGNNSDTYDLWFGPAGAMVLVVDDEPVTGADGLYPYTGLDFASDYEWQVIAMNANGTTNGTVWSFVTACDIFSTPFIEDFESYTGAAPPPTCWLEADNGDPLTGPTDFGSSLWVQDNFGNVTGSSNCPKVNMYAASKREWLITPHIDLSGGGNYAAMFDIAVTAWNQTTPINMGSDDEMHFLISPDGGTTWETLQMWDVTTPVSNTGETVEISLAAYTQSDVVFAFWANEGIVNDAEDYDFFIDNLMIFEAAYGTLDGTVTDMATSMPIEGAEVMIGSFTETTGSDGTYSIPGLLVGDYTASCMATGFNPTTASVTITEDVITIQDFAMTAPTMDIDPLAVDITIDPNAQATEMIDIANNGDGGLAWNAQLELLTDGGTDDLFDLQFSWVAGVGGGEAGIETDGVNIYTTKWNGGDFYRYDMEGNYIETFTCGAASAIRDLAYDGTYFYGAAGAPTVFQMDFTTQTVVGQFTAPAAVRAIAYNEDDNVFYGNNWSEAIQIFDHTGASQGTPFTVGPIGASLYGMAYDNYTGAGQFLWEYAQPGLTPADQNELVQVELPSGVETGVQFNVASVVTPVTGIAGGLCITSDVVAGYWTIMGNMQNEFLWGVELCPAGPVWLAIDPNSGTVDPGNVGMMNLNFDATDIPAGTIKTANIHFHSTPDVGSVTVPVSMTVGDQELGVIEGNVTLDGTAPYNMGDVMEVLVEAGAYSGFPDASGDYTIDVYPGTYDVVAMLYGYETTTAPGIVVASGATVSNVDLTMPTTYGRIMGTVTDVDGGDPISNATITVEGTDFEDVTGADGMYEIFIEAGTYTVMVTHAVYTNQTVDDVEVMEEMDTTLDFELAFDPSCEFSVVLTDDYGDGWNGNTLTISVDGTVVLDNIGLTAGTGPETWYFNTTTGADVVCVYVGTPTTWDYENEYHIFDNDGEEVFADGVGGVAPVGGNFTSTCVVFIFGDLAGTVTEAGSGDPIENAEVTIDDMMALTASDGTYLIEDVMIGTYDVYCEAVGYTSAMASGVEILEEDVTVQDFALGVPEFVVDPLVIDITVAPNGTQQEVVTMDNPGDGDIDWTAAVLTIEDKGTDDLFDLQFSWVAGVGGGEAGIETDGVNIYTTKWNGGDFYRYDMEGNYIETFTCGAASAIRDLAYDGTYFYGAAGAPTVFQMDFTSQTVVSQFSAPAAVRAIAYNEDDDVFYGNNWSEAIQIFDHTGASQGTPFTVGPIGASLYGMAYDNYTGAGQFLWEYAQPGTSPADQNELVQVALPSGVETGVQFNVASVVTPVTGIAGGLCITSDVVSGFWTIMGNMQNEFLWGVELCPAGPLWLSIDPTAGTVAAGTTEDMDLYFDALGLLPGVYEAEIHFTTDPDVGEPVVAVTMTVEGLIPAINLEVGYSCTDVELMWEMPTGGDADSWNVYRDATLLGNVDVMEYTDMMVDPDMEYTYTVTAVYAGDESEPTPGTMITVPVPEDLEPLNLEGTGTVPYTAHLMWEVPDACLAPDSYSIYRNDEMIAEGITELEYTDESAPSGAGVPYYVVAVYYAFESGPSAYAYVDIMTGIEDYDMSLLQVFPNPASELINIKSPVEVSRIHVLNNVGQLVMDEEVNNMEYQIDVSKYEAGFYFIKLETSEGIILRKVTVK